ncbi:hypothetical protein BMJ35_01785 [Sinorhizobium medicae]|uniref:Uncharacterized protein n=1 Tax=Sinorhizobium medicae TaxID=110321 RepID=A0ABX4TD52_9HYPH|nr:hypothetical protein BMJ35_01785 [Sinorhizobium medicae]PLT95065.1 hypothetical protein BMJ33_29560 [Sinorhizobium medicae]PLU12653.1 hypothetical protein BMJ29_31150 [Sinorhizobium medicae]PLU27395.1 hypothetical protein BMJ31_05395 [Sinorhizobium medicae]PLU36063.1 hypothetical protein BMJ27_11090 [Sinorhizobium medicae]
MNDAFSKAFYHRLRMTSLQQELRRLTDLHLVSRRVRNRTHGRRDAARLPSCPMQTSDGITLP